MRDLQHEHLTILKVDVEGAEWDSLAAFLSSPEMISMAREGRIKQLLVEWHWDPDSRAKNARHAKIMSRIEDLGFKPWKVTRHEGSDCCLDVRSVDTCSSILIVSLCYI